MIEDNNQSSLYTKKNLIFTLTGIIIFLSSAILNFYLVHKYSINFPLNNDDGIISLTQLPDKSTLIEYVKYLFGTKNGHPQIIQRIFTTVTYLTIHEVDFRVILKVTSVVLIICFGVHLFTRKETPKFLFTAACSSIFLSFSSEINLWVSAYAAYVFPCIFFSISIVILNQAFSTLRLVLNIIVLIFCVLSFSSGIAAIPCLVIYLFHQRYLAHKIDGRTLLVHLTSLIIPITIFFSIIGHSNVLNLFLNDFFDAPNSTFVFALQMTGSIVRYFNPLNFPLEDYSILFSSIAILSAPFITWRIKRREKAIPFLMIMLFCVLTGLLGATGRAYIGVSGLEPRYEFTGIFFTCGFFGVLLSGISKNRYYAYILILLLTSIGFLRTHQNQKLAEIDHRNNLRLNTAAHVLSDFTKIIPRATASYNRSLGIDALVDNALEKKKFIPDQEVFDRAARFNATFSTDSSTRSKLHFINIINSQLKNRFSKHGFNEFGSRYNQKKRQYRWVFRNNEREELILIWDTTDKTLQKYFRSLLKRKVVTRSKQTFETSSFIYHSYNNHIIRLMVGVRDNEVVSLIVNKQLEESLEDWLVIFRDLQPIVINNLLEI